MCIITENVYIISFFIVSNQSNQYSLSLITYLLANYLADKSVNNLSNYTN